MAAETKNSTPKSQHTPGPWEDVVTPGHPTAALPSRETVTAVGSRRPLAKANR